MGYHLVSGCLCHSSLFSLTKLLIRENPSRRVSLLEKGSSLCGQSLVEYLSLPQSQNECIQKGEDWLVGFQKEGMEPLFPVLRMARSSIFLIRASRPNLSSLPGRLLVPGK